MNFQHCSVLGAKNTNKNTTSHVYCCTIQQVNTTIGWTDISSSKNAVQLSLVEFK